MDMKKCTICETEKPKNKYYSDSRGGLRYCCKECDKEQAKKRYRENREEIIEYQLKRHYENYEPASGQVQKCKGCDELYWCEPNQKGVREYCTKDCWRLDTREERLAKRREWYKERAKNDPVFRLNKNMGFMLWAGLKNKRNNGESIKERLPYTIEELKEHLEKQFKPGMNWDNYGEWHIDHKEPKSSFHFNSVEDKGFEKCWALDNLQPLWDYENYEKGND